MSIRKQCYGFASRKDDGDGMGGDDDTYKVDKPDDNASNERKKNGNVRISVFAFSFKILTSLCFDKALHYK